MKVGGVSGVRGHGRALHEVWYGTRGGGLVEDGMANMETWQSVGGVVVAKPGRQ